MNEHESEQYEPGTVQYMPVSDDGFVRGLIVGTFLSGMIWAVIGAALWWLA